MLGSHMSQVLWLNHEQQSKTIISDESSLELTLLLGTVLGIKMVNTRMRLDHVVSRQVQTNPRRVYSRS